MNFNGFGFIGPITSRPHCEKVSSIVIGCNGIVVFFILPEKFW
jgi:hypothetical protein